uniref:hypothetical protein n=1 Tax=Altererythrobacter segetis TaxID=1104773 RepID=UPI001407A070|nr:hypothetical protein [Altererythrobacter segetis]
MFRRRDPNLLSQYLCRFCGERIAWGAIVRVLRVDPDTPGYQVNESYAHLDCLRRVVRPGVELTFHRHWAGKGPLPDDSGDIDGQPCAVCAEAIAAPELVRLRLQRPAGTVKAPEFDEQSLPFHFECLAAVSTSQLS